MTQGRGASVEDYRAPLFLAWQLTNRCSSYCLHCCEDSGPDKAWPGELDRDQAIRLAGQTVDLGIPYVAFGGGEPLGVPHVWDIFEILVSGGVALKIETNGLLINDAVADRLKALGAPCIQISLDGATAAWHEKIRPNGQFAQAVTAIERLAKRGLAPEVVFVPTRLNLEQAPAVFDLALSLGARAFITGPMMRLGRAAASWENLVPDPAAWARCVEELRERHNSCNGAFTLSIYPWDILEEMRLRLQNPQAMVLVVPDGKAKLLNALPFVCADLKRRSLVEAWQAYRKAWALPEVRDFIERALQNPSLLRHANETWELKGLAEP